jgi:hypothetical protein
VYLLADNDPVKVAEFLRQPLVQYYGILDNKLEQLKKQEENGRKQRAGIH